MRGILTRTDNLRHKASAGRIAHVVQGVMVVHADDRRCAAQLGARRRAKADRALREDRDGVADADARALGRDGTRNDPLTFTKSRDGGAQLFDHANRLASCASRLPALVSCAVFRDGDRRLHLEPPHASALT